MPSAARYFAALMVLALILGGAVWRWRTVGNKTNSAIMKSAIAETASTKTEPIGSPRPVKDGGEPQQVSRPWFRTVNDTGIDFRHRTGTSPEKPFPAANGSGIGAVDYDLDGLQDLYFLTGTPFPIDPNRQEPINRFYRNRGAWQFQDVTSETGLGHNGYSVGVACGDFNHDGFPDIYVACYGSDVLYRNMGDGTFVALDSKSGASDERWATSAAMFDYDQDGLLDIYVCNYGKWTLADNQWCGDQARNIRHYCSPRSIPPERDTLLRNVGDDTFEDATQAAGVGDRLARAQGVVAADLDANGTIDIYVGNDLHANSLFLNDGHGRFQDASESSGAAYDGLGSMQAGMGVDAEDTNGDGLPELIVTNFAKEPNTLYFNSGQGLFQDITQQSGLYAAGLPWVGWGTAFVDFDLDSWPDLVVTNGHVDDNREGEPHAEPPLLWQNHGGNFTFLGAEAGEFFTQNHVGRALVVADLDNDGDQDLVFGMQDEDPILQQNQHRAHGDGQPPVLVLRLVGTRCNRDAIGSTITLRAEEFRRVLQVKGGGSYLSAHDARKFLAIPSTLRQPQLEIRWADGSRSVLENLPTPGSYLVVQPASPSMPARVILAEELQ